MYPTKITGKRKFTLPMVDVLGTGKTLAYLSPIVHHLREEQDQGLISRLNRPRALIVLPNRELAFQVLVSAVIIIIIVVRVRKRIRPL